MTPSEELEVVRKQLVKPGMTAGEMAALLPEHLRPLYWRRKLDEYFTREADA